MCRVCFRRRQRRRRAVIKAMRAREQKMAPIITPVRRAVEVVWVGEIGAVSLFVKSFSTAGDDHVDGKGLLSL